MTQSPLHPRTRHATAHCILLLLLLLASGNLFGQSETEFDPIEIDRELGVIRERLDTGTIDPDYLTSTRARLVTIQSDASSCLNEATADRERLQARFDPLENIDGDVAPDIFGQRLEIQNMLNAAITRQTRCSSALDIAENHITRITDIQNRLSQQFLNNRGPSVIASVTNLPQEMQSWPAAIRGSVDIDLVDGMTPVLLFWMLIIAGGIAAALGLYLRHRFNNWFEAAGGHDAPPEMKYLFPKPLAQYAPLLLEGIALLTVLALSLAEPLLSLAVVRIAAGIFLYGLGCVLIDWATGPLSPSANVPGLIPDHVQPLRIRMRLFVLAVVMSFVILGPDWLAIRNVDPSTYGTASMTFLVALSLLSILLYIRRVPGIQGKIRLIRYSGITALLFGIFALLVGYQNFAGYLIHGVTRTALALAILWILLWLVQTTADSMTKDESSGAEQLRSNLGVSKQMSRTGIGLMQLVTDLIIWISFVVFVIYVWDEAGTTLESLFDLVILGTSVGNIRLVPINIISGILVFAGLIILIGWMKRWIDRRWLQHIVSDRGARDALITLFGYVGFVIAVLIGLTRAEVDLRGLAIVSGAFALGIGLGMQQIANNFVSGLILLFERPIRSGDFVTVGDVEGFVRSIRIRATEIETLDNQNVLVPNSELISGRVTNWVLRDTAGRLRVVVGVAYGSDVAKVKEILEAVANEHPEVITDGRAPGPRALFMGFGDSSLDFELRVRIDRIDRRFSVQSDINFAIDQAFRDSGITIPFPQRDLHLVSYPDPAKLKDETPQIVETDRGEEKADRTDVAGITHDTPSITRSHHEEIEIEADIEDVWTALTDIEWLKRWLAKDGEFPPYIGGRFNLDMQDGAAVAGRIDVFLPPWRLRLVVALYEGDELVASGPQIIELSLHRNEKSTRISVTVDGIPATEDWEEDYRRSEDRWRNGLLELQDLLQGR